MSSGHPISSNPRHSSRSRSDRSGFCSCFHGRARSSRAKGSLPKLTYLPKDLRIPEPLRMDQNELCVALERATLAGGKTATAAKELLKVLQPHLLSEEEDLLQVLGLLSPLAQGQLTPAMQSIPRKTERLKARMFDIAREHALIHEATDKLLRDAQAEGKSRLVTFCEHLRLRAWTDEVVFYPAAILIGEYIKLKLRDRPVS